jgi:hypothetical protein
LAGALGRGGHCATASPDRRSMATAVSHCFELLTFIVWDRRTHACITCLLQYETKCRDLEYLFRERQEKVFFFEKKKQKTFDS